MGKDGFRALKVWRRARDLAVSVYEHTRKQPLTHDFAMVDQVRRSAISVPSNIAEGDERDTDRDAIRFFYIAKGSLAELRTQLEIAQLVGYVSESDWQTLDEDCARIARMLGALIKARSQSPK